MELASVMAGRSLTTVFKPFRAFKQETRARAAIIFIATFIVPFIALALAPLPAVALPALPAAPAFIAAPSNPQVAADESKALGRWLQQMHEAARTRSYTGIFVIHSGSSMSSAKITHVAQGGQQAERVETLTGTPRIIYRHNNQVITFLPQQKTMRRETRDSIGLFPGLVQATDSQIGDFYQLRPDGNERVAGVEADKVVLLPRDNLRFGYRIWAERKSALVVKLQTIDSEGNVLEQAAFSQLQMDAGISLSALQKQMGQVQGWKVAEEAGPALAKTTANAEGWMLKTPVPGFESTAAYKRVVPGTQSPSKALEPAAPFQWVFSDGMASVSIFIEPLAPGQLLAKRDAAGASVGATQMWTQPLGNYALTLMGEVPLVNLRLFADSIRRQ